MAKKGATKSAGGGFGLVGFLGKLAVVGCVLSGVGAVGIQYYLQQPGQAEAAVRKLVKMGNVPESIFNHIKVHDESAWYDMLTRANIGTAEAYMAGKIDLDLLPFFLTLLNGTAIGTAGTKEDVGGGWDVLSTVTDLLVLPGKLVGNFFDRQTRQLSKRVTEQHYDAGNDLYEVMLGRTMSYTCAYFKGLAPHENATVLDDAQTNKFDLIRRKLEMEPGMKVADLGMGWGTAAAYMHSFGGNVTGLTLSKEQHRWASANLAKPGLRFLHVDYRDLCQDPEEQGTYDRVYSIGMHEHVGPKNFRAFYTCVKQLLKPDGLAVIHTIGENEFISMSDPFIEKYIFPGAVIPALSSVTKAFEPLFVLEDFQNFGHDYSRTLSYWHDNAAVFFKENPTAYTPEFQRMWNYYLKLSEALFALRINQLWHFVLSPRPVTRDRVKRFS